MKMVMSLVKVVVDMVMSSLMSARKMLRKPKVLISLAILAVVVIAAVSMMPLTENFMMSMEDDKKLLDAMQGKEDFHDNLPVDKDSVPERTMWNMSNITTNQSYDTRGEMTNIVKEPVSITQNSELDDNLLNERVMQ